MQYWIMGAGGIGCALADTLVARGDSVVLFSRSKPALSERAEQQVVWHEVDNTDSAALAQLCDVLALPDKVINTLGMLQQADQRPEQRRVCCSLREEQQARSGYVRYIH